MNPDATVLLALTRSEMGLVIDALELMEDAEHLRPWRQELAADLLAKIDKLTALCDYAMWELEK